MQSFNPGGWFDYTRYSRYPPQPFGCLTAEIATVENLLWYHRFRYYVLDDPEIDDAAYDTLEHHLRSLYHRIRVGRARLPAIPPRSVLRTVGSSMRVTYPANITRYFATLGL